jgi:four helix bundle protein
MAFFEFVGLVELQRLQSSLVMKINRFEEIQAWQGAQKLVRMVYDMINEGNAFRKDLRLSGQIQSAAVSSMSNIAEGFARRGNREFVQFLFIAKSSATEVQSHLYVAVDQGYIPGCSIRCRIRPSRNSVKNDVRSD